MTTAGWGYERADCRGDFALSLFLDDMDRLVRHYAAQNLHPDTRLVQAQAAANKLVRAYGENARGTQAFSDQSIQIKSFVDESGSLVLVPIFSAELKKHLVSLLNRSDPSTLH